MIDDTTAAFSSPAIAYKIITAAFNGGRITSDSGVVLLSPAERLTGFVPDARDPTRVTGSFTKIFNTERLHSALGYRSPLEFETAFAQNKPK